MAKFYIETNLSFNTSNALSINGSNDLNIVKGTVDFKIFNKLGWKPTESFDSGIKKTINWYLNNIEFFK